MRIDRSAPTDPSRLVTAVPSRSAVASARVVRSMRLARVARMERRTVVEQVRRRFVGVPGATGDAQALGEVVGHVHECRLVAALLVAGCAGGGDRGAESSGPTGGEVFLQPLGAAGPDPFTASTVTPAATGPPVTRTPQSPSTGTQGGRSFSGATPGLYGGTRNAGSCDIDQQIRLLDADRGKARAFAEASGISPGSVPDYLRGLTPVVLRADTRVTNHGFGDGRATGQSADGS